MKKCQLNVAYEVGTRLTTRRQQPTFSYLNHLCSTATCLYSTTTQTINAEKNSKTKIFFSYTLNQWKHDT